MAEETERPYDIPRGRSLVTLGPSRLRPRKPMGAYARRIGRGVGRGVGAVGRGAYEVGAGFAEGVGLRAPKITPRGVGRVAGVVAKETVKGAARVELKPSEYFWGKPAAKQFTPSRLPIEVQHSMVSLLGEMYPEAYRNLWEPGIRMSDFVGKLRVHHPDIYEDLKGLTYSQLTPRYQQQPYPYPYGAPPSIYPTHPGYPPTGPPMGPPFTI